MFLNDRLVYLELHKTASTRIGRLLRELVGGQQIGKHQPLAEPSRGRFVLGSVRNPWHWYVSLWAYGCQGQGQLRNQLLESDPSWADLYRDCESPERLREWLYRIHDRTTRDAVGDELASSPASSYAGLMTLRYCRIFHRDFRAWATSAAAETYEALRRRDADDNLLSGVVRCESLEAEILRRLEEAGYRWTPAMRRRLRRGAAQKVNESRHRCADSYYDEKSAAFVARRDRLLIQKYDYTLRNIIA